MVVELTYNEVDVVCPVDVLCLEVIEARANPGEAGGCLGRSSLQTLDCGDVTTLLRRVEEPPMIKPG